MWKKVKKWLKRLFQVDYRYQYQLLYNEEAKTFYYRLGKKQGIEVRVPFEPNETLTAWKMNYELNRIRKQMMEIEKEIIELKKIIRTEIGIKRSPRNTY